MSIKNGLTTWCMKVRSTAVMWRWNMPLGEALSTCDVRSFGQHGYCRVGPLIVEW